MKIHFMTDALQPMLSWLSDYKASGCRDEGKLVEILSLPEYQVEFQRYGMAGLPVCGISFDEAVDFFMNFDRKDFENPRLQYKKESFLSFFNELEQRAAQLKMFCSLSSDDIAQMELLLRNGLPASVTEEIGDLNLLLIVSIGNSMGWPFGSYIDYDAANMNLFTSREDFIHVTAHEIHHILLGPLLAPEGIAPEDFFLQSFAFEGLAVHYNNNQPTLGKRSKYPGPVYMMQQEDMDFYESNFDRIFAMIREDYYKAKQLTMEETASLVGEHYEQFTFLGKPVMQYPTYYFGCYMWGLVDLVYGKEKMYEAIAAPHLFVQLYNQAAGEKYRF